METTFILGAGFSIPSSYPSGQALNEKFFSNVEKNILKFSSGEWAWDEYSKAESNNGRLNSDHLNISFLLSELVSTFQEEFSMPFDYEEFYDWINRPYSKEFILKACTKVNKRLSEQGIHRYHLFKNPDINEYSRIKEAYVYLIADLLNRPYESEKSLHHYSGFADIITKDSNSNIFTLNHDLLLEFILMKNKIHYSDGFTSKNVIVNEKKEPLPVFTNEFGEGINMHKLHGSVDYFCFSEM